MQIKPYGYFESFLKRAILTSEHQTLGNSLTTVLDTCNLDLDLDAMLKIFIYMLCLHVLIVFFWYFRENWSMKYKTKTG